MVQSPPPDGGNHHFMTPPPPYGGGRPDIRGGGYRGEGYYVGTLEPHGHRRSMALAAVQGGGRDLTEQQLPKKAVRDPVGL